MLASDVINMFRLLTATPSQPGGRWSDANILSFVDMAQRHLVQELLFPSSRLTTTTVANVQYYQLPDTLRIDRVYLNGQIIVEVAGNIDTLEGRQIGYYDQYGSGSFTPTSDGPPGTVGPAAPQWSLQAPTSYPFVNNWGPPAPATGPNMIGQQPVYYRRGGGIGIVPLPAGNYTLAIDCVLSPTRLVNTTDTLLVPSNYLDALAWYTVVLAKFADDTQGTNDQRNFAQQMYMSNLSDLRSWVRQYSIDEGKVLVRNNRNYFVFGGNRVNNTNGMWW
jgi:hypothetical protein